MRIYLLYRRQSRWRRDRNNNVRIDEPRRVYADFSTGIFRRKDVQIFGYFPRNPQLLVGWILDKFHMLNAGVFGDFPTDFELLSKKSSTICKLNSWSIFLGWICGGHIALEPAGAGTIWQPSHPSGWTSGVQMSHWRDPRSHLLHDQRVTFGKRLTYWKFLCAAISAEMGARYLRNYYSGLSDVID